ncbi:ABC transporter permease [Anoxybacillus eryuanensis]|uniref:ABC transporter permease n=1 Tax=Anoxybacillus eryuanensis TaxID=651866 RepID=UPI003F4A4BC1
MFILRRQVNVEFNRMLNKGNVIVWVSIIFFPIAYFFIIKDQYIFYRHIEIFLRLYSGGISLFFPILMVLLYTVHFFDERRNYFLLYARARVPLPYYLFSKIIVNATVSFVISFLMMFIPFIFCMYIVPKFELVRLYEDLNNPIPYTTFEQLLSLGNLPYGVIYSTWVGLNGMLYATFGLVLVMLMDRMIVALFIPFIYYLLGTFFTQIIGMDKFSPDVSIFPFRIFQQPIWTALVPFFLLAVVVTVLMVRLKGRVDEMYV